MVSVLPLAINYPDEYRINDYNSTKYASSLDRTPRMNVEETCGWYPNFNSNPFRQGGENPGKLGHEIREMSDTPSITIDRDGGNAPSLVLDVYGD